MDKENLEQFNSDKKGSKFSSIFEALRLKHLILFLLCLLFLGILIGGGSNKKEPHQLAIKKKKHQKYDKKNDQISKKAKEFGNSVVEKTKEGTDKVKEKTADLVDKTKETVGNATSAAKETASNLKDKAEKTVDGLKEKVDQSVGTSAKKEKEITDISKISEDSDADVRDIAAIDETSGNGKETGFFKGLFGKNDSKQSDCKVKSTDGDEKAAHAEKEKDSKCAKTTTKADKADNGVKKKPNQISKQQSSDKNAVVESEIKSDNKGAEKAQEAGVNSENDISSLKAEINSLKQQVKQLSMKSNSVSGEKTSSENDENIIEERIKFWQSMKEQANSF